ncbi:hypothetical protein [Parabacteroides distasonis]|uniref:hypothetical protein n=1 Tax=Parabacteroides distasonis TaxID=823 RepID=UPI0012F514F9|nr:hypothetical protein [Parabacteroides distasonis]MBM6515290.1 hypothetical protein [Parabacteroides distasonis]
MCRGACPLPYWGIFSDTTVLRLGKFPNKLRYFLRKYPAACRLLARNHTLFFPFRSVVGDGAVVSVFKGFFARGGRMQGLGEEYYPKYEGGDCSPNGVAA